MTLLSSKIHFRIWSVWLALLLGVLGAVAQGADVSVRASLSRGITVIGDPVQYQIKITGARRVVPPPEPEVDGVVIRYSGPSENAVMRFQNGSFTSERTTTLVYEVVPERNGTFTIPAVAVEADGKTFHTEPVGLTVQPSSTPGNNDPETIGFAELVVPKKTAYLGEAIPLELRLYVDARVRWQPIAMPEIAGDGFTKQKMPEPQRSQVQKNGKEYDMLTFKTAIMPVRAGKITIGPAEIAFNARVPRARRGGSRSLLDMFDDDVFGDPFFSVTQQMKAKAAALELTVKPLPAAGKPGDFSGAVGTFQLAAEGSPKQVKVGDPVTMKLRVSGRGNFDRMTAPVIKDPAGWRSYPPSNAFKADDDVGISGTKTFEMAVVPEVKKTQMPAFQFSYFDALAEKYITLTTEPAPLSVEGGVAPAPPVPIPVGEAERPPAPPAPSKPDDIVGLRYDRDAVQSFVPLHQQREFWLAQGAAGLVLLGFLGLKLRRRPDSAAMQMAALRREKAEALARLRNGELPHVEFVDAAARVAQIETALVTGRPASGIDAGAVRASARLDDTTAEVIDEIFNARAELLFAGGGRGDGRVPAAERDRVLAALKQLERSHAKN
jgi:hypothetical protein